MRYLSLFSGLEGASLAWKPLAWIARRIEEALRTAAGEERE